jgi:two-component system, chemotaxis family, sensor kinase CheA
MNDSDIVKDFLVESYENLDRLDRDLVGLEKNPRDKEALAGVFRTIHTIKGTCGFLGFNKLEKVAHVGENLLTRLRDGLLTLNPEITTALLGMVDAVRQMLKEIQSTGQDGEVDYPELRENPDAAAAGGGERGPADGRGGLTGSPGNSAARAEGSGRCGGRQGPAPRSNQRAAPGACAAARPGSGAGQARRGDWGPANPGIPASRHGGRHDPRGRQRPG